MNNSLRKIIKHLKPKKIDISVIIPFHNVEEYIDECLDSLFSQTGVDIEVILVDDGSTDSTSDIVKNRLSSQDNMHLYRISQNGPGYARNYGVQFVKGEFIAFLDADDILLPGIYRRMLRAARNNAAEVCICNVARFDSEKRYGSDLQEKVYRDYKKCTNIKETPSLIYDTCAWNKLINRDFYIKNGISFPEHVIYEDISANIDIHLKCNKVVMIAETGYLWRVRDKKGNPSISQKFYSEKNTEDRFKASNWIVENVLNKELPEKLKKAAQYRLLETDLRIILDSAEHVSVEQALKTFARVTAFVKDNIDEETLEQLSLIDLQRYKYAEEGNVEGYLKLLDYRRKSYSKAPVTEREGSLYITLPDEVFTIQKRAVNEEMARLPRRTWVDDVRLGDDGIEIDAHSYIQRYNMQDPDCQKISVYLINEETNTKIKIPHSFCSTEFLTETYGDVYDDTTKTNTHYNYDSTGFTFKAGKELIDQSSKNNKIVYSVIVEYEDRLFSGKQIVKGVTKKVKRKAKELQVDADNRFIHVRFGGQDELQIIIQKKLR